MPADPDDPLVHPPLFGELSHRGRVVRVMLGLALAALGWLLPVPYAGYAYALALFAPALVLLAFGTLGLRRRARLSFVAPAALGVAFSVVSCIVSPTLGGGRLFEIALYAIATTGAAVLFGFPRAKR